MAKKKMLLLASGTKMNVTTRQICPWKMYAGTKDRMPLKVPRLSRSIM